MTGKIERSVDELYQDDAERADAIVFGRGPVIGRRGFLGGGALAAMGAAVGGSIPFAASLPGGLIPAALAQGAPPKGPQYLNFPGKSDKLVVLGERPLVAETPEHMLDDDTTPTTGSSSATTASFRTRPRSPRPGRSWSTARSTRRSSSRSAS